VLPDEIFRLPAEDLRGLLADVGVLPHVVERHEGVGDAFEDVREFRARRLLPRQEAFRRLQLRDPAPQPFELGGILRLDAHYRFRAPVVLPVPESMPRMRIRCQSVTRLIPSRRAASLFRPPAFWSASRIRSRSSGSPLRALPGAASGGAAAALRISEGRS